MARADDEKTVHLVVKPPVGYAVRIKNIFKTSVGGMDLVITSIQKITVQAVKENGDIVEETAFESTVVHSDNGDMDLPAGAPYTVTYNKFGKILAFPPIGEGGRQSPEAGKIMGVLAALVMTDRPVKPNDTWQPDVVQSGGER